MVSITGEASCVMLLKNRGRRTNMLKKGRGGGLRNTGEEQRENSMLKNDKVWGRGGDCVMLPKNRVRRTVR